MSTERIIFRRMKTPLEILESGFETQNLTGMVRDGVVKAMEEYANQAEGRANALEEWLTEYRDQLKKGNVYHKKRGIINAINELLNGDDEL